MFYSFVCFLIGLFARTIFRIRIIGWENIPRTGGVIVAANHLSYLDIPFLGYSIGRGANFMGKKELFSIPVLGRLLLLLGAIPVDRGKLDRTALREAVKSLKSGKVLVIYPEGTRSIDGRLQPGKPGVGMIVKMSKALVIPAAIIDTDKAMPPGRFMIKPVRVTIKFGRPIDFSSMIEDKIEKVDIEKITTVIMDNISALLDTKILL